MDKQKKYAISYIRFSSIGQQQGSSTARQTQMREDWLSQNLDYELLEGFEDLGVSAYRGRHLEQGELGELLEFVKSRKLPIGSVVLVESIDRIGRMENLTLINLISNIVEFIDILTLEDGIRYSKQSLNKDPSQLYILVGKIQMAGNYSDNLSRRIGASWDRRQVIAKAGGAIKVKTPFYLDTENNLNEKAPVMRRMIDLYLEGHGDRRIAATIKDEFDIAFRESTIKRGFQNKALYGTWTVKGQDYPNVFEPLITEEEYWTLQAIVKDRSRVTKNRTGHLLSGLVVCRHCGYKYSVSRNKNARTAFICSGSKVMKIGCHNRKAIPEAVLMFIFEMTKYKPYNRILQKQIDDEVNSDLLVVNAQIEDIDSKIAKLQKLALLTDDIESLADQINELKARRSELNESKSNQADRRSRASKLYFDGNITEALQIVGYQIMGGDDKVFECEGMRFSYDGYKRIGKSTTVYIVNDQELVYTVKDGVYKFDMPDVFIPEIPYNN
ncbi:recombinase family protein [Endozoicomonas sp. ALB032]|uniref:recombinase family protein n=1 Tax=Endozoicomonas sp. ALB032 TaxID=3403082 RepID=UPI003BB5DAC3